MYRRQYGRNQHPSPLSQPETEDKHVILYPGYRYNPQCTELVDYPHDFANPLLLKIAAGQH